MRRKSGLRLIGSDGRVIARLKSEYRGAPIEESYSWTYHPSSRRLPPDDCFFVFVLEKLGPDGLRALMRTLEERGMNLEYRPGEFERALRFLVGQGRANAEA
jgi:hypothetical protein